MIEHLPERLDLLATADAGRSLQGTMPLATLERLLPALSSAEGELRVCLELGKDPDGTRFVRGRISGVVTLLCQRCLEPMSLPLDIRFCLGIVREELAMNMLHESYEPLLVGAEPTRLTEIVTDEVLLALPLVPAHADNSACHAYASEYRAPQPERHDGPFAALAGLKQKP
jgi:uncharacterized protein